MVNIKRIGHVRHCPRQLLSFPFPFFHLVLDSAKFMLLMKKGHGRALKILQLGLWFTIRHTYKNSSEPFFAHSAKFFAHIAKVSFV